MKDANPTRLDNDKTFVFGFSTAIAIDDPKLTIKWTPGTITNGQESTECPYEFMAGSLELIRTELHKRIDDIIGELYGD
ncbi:hypothetical protein LCGC14_1010060 [marine sediment metagenome]|uniref:Uncharacterized protein n=1 Tax=marine sediment metagenome TaxID=412755 RepID=A0A0F9NLX6_9ZZZZ